jgi:hypothetical protein
MKNWVKLKYDNTMAQAAIIYLYVAGLVMGISVYIYLSPIMESFTNVHNNLTQGATPLMYVSQNTQDSIFITQLAFRDWPIIYFILLTIAAYAAALKYRSNQL